MGWYNITLRDCKIAGLPETETKEGQDYRFRRRGLEGCLPEIDSPFYAERGLSLAAAITLLESKPKTSTGKITLSVDEAETLRRVLQENKISHEMLSVAACHAHGLLAVVDEAGKLYREGKRSAAVMKIDWTLGKRRQLVPHADIFSNYLLMTYWPEPWRKTKDEAVDALTKRFKMQSRGATIKSLQRTLASIRRSNPDIAVVLPSSSEYDKKPAPKPYEHSVDKNRRK
jgi:hypothetical protein